MHIGEKENWEKFTLWEESTRVPLFLMAPGITKSNTMIEKPVSTVDIYPTLAELIGEVPPPHCDGQSLVPLLTDPDADHEPPVTAFDFDIITNKSPYNKDLGLGPSYTVRTLHYRYIYYPSSGLEELYDHRTDPNEWDNIAYRKSKKEVIKEHRNYLLKKVPDLKWTNKVPEGYLIKDEKIERVNFVPLKKLAYPK